MHKHYVYKHSIHNTTCIHSIYTSTASTSKHAQVLHLQAQHLHHEMHGTRGSQKHRKRASALEVQRSAGTKGSPMAITLFQRGRRAPRVVLQRGRGAPQVVRRPVHGAACLLHSIEQVSIPNHKKFRSPFGRPCRDEHKCKTSKTTWKKRNDNLNKPALKMSPDIDIHGHWWHCL